jgi:hypothetical protein
MYIFVVLTFPLFSVSSYFSVLVLVSQGYSTVTSILRSYSSKHLYLILTRSNVGIGIYTNQGDFIILHISYAFPSCFAPAHALAARSPIDTWCTMPRTSCVAACLSSHNPYWYGIRGESSHPSTGCWHPHRPTLPLDVRDDVGAHLGGCIWA